MWNATLRKPKVPPQDRFFNTIRAVRSAIVHLGRFGDCERARANLKKRLHVLGIEDGELDRISEQVDALLVKHLNGVAEVGLKKWKARVATWHAQSKELFQYLRNTKPARSCVVQHKGKVVSDPIEVSLLLMGVWGSIEFWTAEQRDYAMHVLEDHLAIFLPRVDMQCIIIEEILFSQVKKMKKTSPGVDGWTQGELKALPKRALDR